MNGVPLQLHRVSTLITKTHGYRGTLCGIDGTIEFDYLVRKINGEETANLHATRAARTRMVQTMEALIGDLSDRDFETLVDLLFRQAGWQRLGDVGGVQKTLDIVLRAPVTGELYGVQVKVRADYAVYEAWRAECKSMEGFTAFYFAVQKPPLGTWNEATEMRHRLLRPRRIAELAVDYGLIGWVLEKSV